ncbi:NHLP family bacteriocin export ABC transporter peptidase/permease/ATPase subunit [Synechococcus sp. CBW1108]|uniref:NHLP family bacteriocin export ABC transporter peptidase/permease/ATPase subunit n=1 Tax=Synechococcus sp. CBW1108 TaxID=1353147 RepID=UPI0018CFAB4D|nr:NHLP family bacteriocin export ABC transporter peptidase/permease/ATPase subunit [Synechococcus sp. CBW1108]QPN70740.1 NHLP family bacteriocin export ABC transporter peptidase/permease/ATPase subunit [Synechococcus sp. CBW1108]
MGRIRTPTVLQMEASECGAACLGILLRHYGRVVPLLELRKVCGVTRDGSNAASLLRAGALYGLEGKGYRMDLEALLQQRPPLILFWEFNHFLVFEGFQGNRVALNDPATGPRWVSLETFSAGFTGVVLQLVPGPSFQQGGRDTKAWRLVGGRLQQEWRAALFTLLAGLLLLLPQLAMPVFTQIYIDDVWGSSLRDWLKPMLWAMALAITVQAIGSQLQQLGIRHLSQRLESQGALAFERHVLDLPDGFFRQRYAGDISQRQSLNRTVADFIAQKLLPLINGGLLLVLYLLLTLSYSPKLGLVVAITTALNALLVMVSLRQQRDATQQLEKDSGKAEGTLTAALMEIEMVKSTAIETDVMQRFDGYQRKAQAFLHRLSLRQAALGLWPNLLSQLNTLGVLIVGFLLVVDGRLTLGMLLSAQQVASGLKGEVDRLVGFVADLPEVETAVLRLDDVLSHPIDPLLQYATPAQLSPWPAERQQLSGLVEIKDLGFSFSPVRPSVISDLSITISPGMRVALVGESGSGKSTVARLIAGLLPASSGSILFDGYPLTAIPRNVAVGSLAMVQQDITIYGLSIRENLRLWRSDLTDLQLLQACREAQFDWFIETLPGGLNTVLQEGGRNLSGGQRQRLELARALLQDPAILILDEATSALDADTEWRIEEALRCRSCTQIVVAHRLSSIQDADLILVLDGGVVVQRGRHQSLIRESEGAYAKLLKTEGS